MDTPLSNGSNGRDVRGRFTPGYKGGPGNPFARRCAVIRKAFLEAISEEDIKAIVRMLVNKAKGGDLVPSKLVLLWAIGRPVDPHHPDVVERMVAAAEAHTAPAPLTDDREARYARATEELLREMRRE